jgi:hypothetical protein
MINRLYLILQETLDTLYECLPNLTIEQQKIALKQIQTIEEEINGWETGEKENKKEFYLQDLNSIILGTISDKSPNCIDLVLNEITKNSKKKETQLRLTLQKGKLLLKTKTLYHNYKKSGKNTNPIRNFKTHPQDAIAISSEWN